LATTKSLAAVLWIDIAIGRTGREKGAIGRSCNWIVVKEIVMGLW
jgi:hypothetical protein